MISKCFADDVIFMIKFVVEHILSSALSLSHLKINFIYAAVTAAVAIELLVWIVHHGKNMLTTNRYLYLCPHHNFTMCLFGAPNVSYSYLIFIRLFLAGVWCTLRWFRKKNNRFLSPEFRVPISIFSNIMK